MEYKVIRLVGVLSLLMMVVVLGVSTWELFGERVRPAPNTWSWMAFFFLSLLATRVGSILEIQADEIAHLKQQLVERQPAL